MAESGKKDNYSLLGVKKTASPAEIEDGFLQKFLSYLSKSSRSSDKVVRILNAYQILRDQEKRTLYDKRSRHGNGGNKNTGIPRKWSPQTLRQYLNINGKVSRRLRVPAEITFCDAFSQAESRYIAEELSAVVGTPQRQVKSKDRSELKTSLKDDTQRIVDTLIRCIKFGHIELIVCILLDDKRTSLKLAVAQLVNSYFKPTGDRCVMFWELIKGFYYIRYFPGDPKQVRIGHDCLNKAFWSGCHEYRTISVAMSRIFAGEFSATGFFLANVIFPSPGERLNFIQEDASELTKPDFRLCATCKSKTVRAFEESVKRWKDAGEWSDIDVALAYGAMDALCSSPSELAMARINAARWLLSAMKFSDVEEAQLPLYMSVVYEFAQECMSIAYRNLSAPMKFLFARLCLAVCKEAGRIGGGSRNELDICVDYMKSAAFYSHFVPLWRPPIVSVSEIEQINVAYTELQNAFMTHLNDVEADRTPIRRALISYSLFENNQQSALAKNSISAKYREMAMIDLLKEHQMSMGDVQNLMRCPLFERDADGWYQRSDRLLNSHQLEGFRSIHGFTIDKKTNEIVLLMNGCSDSDVDSLASKSDLLWWDDLAEMTSMEGKFEHGLLFSLDPPDVLFRDHPFQTFRYQPANVKRGLLLHTLFHTDYILKQLILGVEVSSKPPFAMRRCSRDGIFKGLPDRAIHVLRPVTERGSAMASSARYWIHAEYIQYEETETDSEVKCLVGDVKMSVRCRELVHDANGKLIDAPTGHGADTTADQHFCDNFTANYDKISRYYPEFARLKELCKLDFIMTRLRQYELEGMNIKVKSLCQSANAALDGKWPSPRRYWVPAAFSYHNNHVIYGGVSLCPVAKGSKRQIRNAGKSSATDYCQ